MSTIPSLGPLALILLVGVAVAALLGRLRIPAAAGLLAAGALVGPHGLGLVTRPETIDALAEVGVVLLLFTIGLEFSIERLKVIARQVILGGSLQVGLTIAGVVLTARALGEPMQRAILYGFIFAQSSTAIVLRGLAERGEVDAPHGRITVGALIFQDLCVVPMVLLVPVLAGSGEGAAQGILLALGKATLLVAVTVGFGRALARRLFSWVDATRSREIFLLAVVGVCIGTAWLTSLMGLSLALGAFLAGMVLADSDYAHRALTDVLPLRDALTSLFFMSLGMLFDVQVIASRPQLVFSLLLGLLVGKGFVATLSALAMRFPSRVAWLAGVSLAQFSEFGFVLAKLGEGVGLLKDSDSAALLSAGVLSMFLTPMAMRLAPRFTAGERLLRPLERLLRVSGVEDAVKEQSLAQGHVVIVGYGLSGKLLARALAACGVRYLVLELNAESVRRAHAGGEPVYYGDATSPEVLAHVRLEHAQALVLMINDAEAARRTVAAARSSAPSVPIFVRTRYLNEQAALIKAGADVAVFEELEAGLEMMARVLRRAGVPRNLIVAQLRQARENTQETERRLTLPRPRLGELAELTDLKIESFLVEEKSHANGRNAVELRLRSRTGALLVALRRKGALLNELAPTMAFEAGDTLFLVGSGESLRAGLDLLERGEERPGEPATS